MSRVRRDDNVGFESDSFLDIIANIVGILIILIVLAGVRVSQFPVTTEKTVTVENKVDAPESVVPLSTDASPIDNKKIFAIDPQSQPELLTIPPEVKPSVIVASQELLSQEADIRKQIALLQSQQQAEENRFESILLNKEASRQKLHQLEQQLLLAQKNSKEQTKKIVKLHSILNREKMLLADAQASWDEASREKKNVKQIKHKLTPIGHEVKKEEIHFHLKANKISHVPIKKLIERLKPQVRRQQQWLTKFNRYQGEVGPVDGFTMKYIMERKRLTVIEELRSGHGMMSISVTGWKILPEPDLESETAKQALQPGSNFLLVLQQAPLDATLTMWVYPDSFPLYRQLQKFAQREGYRIAARPLPQGVSIAGSPSGSRSVGQ